MHRHRAPLALCMNLPIPLLRSKHQPLSVHKQFRLLRLALHASAPCSSFAILTLQLMHVRTTPTNCSIPVACAVTLLGLRITRVCSPFSSDRKPSLNLFLALQLPFHRMNLSTPNRLHVAVGFNTAQVAIPATDGTVLRLSYLQSF
ncbi:hypothetical protein BLNAU_23510 [Blattamonas nauphoetae]|uniref:Uncharacterized protein n=1 Tax=Blattamonas nauphoetae TaxID=2049346 RepID=A0ABQ9WQ27_9EUKA|nr:hypothetical protein BLNAU_23510 [Blattamonas nauphoetae]